MARPKTLVLHLTSWDPQGIRTVEILGTNRRALMVPRADIANAATRTEMSKPAVYFLFGENPEGEVFVYIGETTNLLNRLTTHKAEKEFWEKALAFTVVDDSLGPTEIKYLEALAIRIASEAKRYPLKNTKRQILSNLSEWKMSEMESFLEDMDLVSSTFGFPVLQKVVDGEDETRETYECVGPHAHAKGIYGSEGMVVLAGSLARKDLTPTTPENIKVLRGELTRNWTLRDNGNGAYEFARDYAFATPSAASGTVLGRSSNGWDEWRNARGSLHENERATFDHVK